MSRQPCDNATVFGKSLGHECPSYWNRSFGPSLLRSAHWTLALSDVRCIDSFTARRYFKLKARDMTQTVGRLLSFLLLLLAAVFAYQRAQEREYIGIDFVQFHLTGLHVVHGGDPHVYSEKVRREILERAWQEAKSEGIESKFFHAVNFRHVRSWESYSSPFLYVMFGAGENGRSRAYERALNYYWIVCLVSTMIGFITFGWVLRIPGWSMVSGAVILVLFSPLRIDMNVANVDQIQFGMVGVLAAILSLPADRSLRRPESLSPEGIEKTESRRRSDGTTVRHFLAGVWLGLCLAFKPSLLWCGVMWLGSMLAGRWDRQQHAQSHPNIAKQLLAATIGGAVGGFIAIVFTSIWFPPDSWIEWVQAVRLLPDDIIQTHQGNFSPTYFARSCGVPGWLTSLAGLVLAGALVFVIRHRQRNNRNPMSLESHSTQIALWLAIGCQIHLLTSNLVWYQYCVLSLPAVLVILREVVWTPSRRDAILLSGILLWCLLLLGVQPVDHFVASPPVEHMWRCAIGNAILLMLMVIVPKASEEALGSKSQSIRENSSSRG